MLEFGHKYDINEIVFSAVMSTIWNLICLEINLNTYIHSLKRYAKRILVTKQIQFGASGGLCFKGLVITSVIAFFDMWQLLQTKALVHCLCSPITQYVID